MQKRTQGQEERLRAKRKGLMNMKIITVGPDQHVSKRNNNGMGNCSKQTSLMNAANVDPVVKLPFSTKSRRSWWWLFNREASLHEKPDITISTDGTWTIFPLSSSLPPPLFAISLRSLNKYPTEKLSRIKARLRGFNSHAQACRKDMVHPVNAVRTSANGFKLNMYNSDPEHNVPTVMTCVVPARKPHALAKRVISTEPKDEVASWMKPGRRRRCASLGYNGWANCLAA
jgi:hypothetical protein